MIIGYVKQQELCLNASHIVSDSVDYQTAKFYFKDSSWDGFVKYAHFLCGGTAYDVPLTDDKITADQHLNFSAGTWECFVSGHEYADGAMKMRIVTESVSFSVTASGASDGEVFPSTPATAYEQLEGRVQKLEESGSSGGGSGGTATDPEAVKYTEQSLTDEQKMQARKNLGLYSKSVTEIEAISETEVTFSGGKASLESLELVAGKKYFFVIDGTTYEGTSKYNNITFWIEVSCGDYVIATDINCIKNSNQPDGVATVRLYYVGEVFEKIPDEYLPDSIKNAVLFTAQEKTGNEKSIARKNIDAVVYPGSCFTRSIIRTTLTTEETTIEIKFNDDIYGEPSLITLVLRVYNGPTSSHMENVSFVCENSDSHKLVCVGNETIILILKAEVDFDRHCILATVKTMTESNNDIITDQALLFFPQY